MRPLHLSPYFPRDSFAFGFDFFFSFHPLQQKPDDIEYQIDDEIISKEETSYRDKKKKSSIGKGSSTAIVPSQTGLQTFKPSFVMYQPNRNQRWLYDTPGVISENQVKMSCSILFYKWKFHALLLCHGNIMNIVRSNLI